MAEQDFFGDRGFGSEPVYLTDMDRCTPSGSIGRESARGKWRAFDYETEGFDGVLLMAGPETEAPDIVYPLDVTGWHAVSIGIHPTDRGQSRQSRLLVKLSGDDAYVEATWEPDGHLARQRLEEIFWKTADLSGQQIHFRQFRESRVPGSAGARPSAAPRASRTSSSCP